MGRTGPSGPFEYTYKPGTLPPCGYVGKSLWAHVQLLAGLQQARCPICGLWKFPQEQCCRAKKRKKGGE